MSDRVYVHESGDRFCSPNSKEDLCRAVLSLAAENKQLQERLADRMHINASFYPDVDEDELVVTDLDDLDGPA